MATKLMVSIRESHSVNPLKRARKQPWYWVLINTANNRVMARSSESYTNYADCESAAKLVNGGTVDVYLRHARGITAPSELIRYAQTPQNS
jgi:uncharacterized protein YegP (UPF0339 family)